jgi:stage V sporulation protein S
MTIIRVAARSRPATVAGVIARVVRERQRAKAQAIGAKAVNQAIKAVIIARQYLALDGMDVICLPEFTEVDIDGLERTAIRIIVEPRESPPPQTDPEAESGPG